MSKAIVIDVGEHANGYAFSLQPLTRKILGDTRGSNPVKGVFMAYDGKVGFREIPVFALKAVACGFFNERKLRRAVRFRNPVSGRTLREVLP